MAGVFFLIWLLGYLHRHLRRAEGEDSWLAAIAYGGGWVLAGLILVLVGFAFAQSELSSYGDDTQVAKTYFVFSWNAFSMLAPPAGAMVIATAVAGLSHDAFPRAFSWFSLLAGALTIVVAVSGADGLAAFIALAWMAVASLVLTVDAWRHPAVSTP